MQRSVLVISILSAWVMALAFDQIDQIFGVRFIPLWCAAVITMIFGLYAGLRSNNEEESKEEL